jgi:DNA-binding NarL/FixJ family response regulator
MCDILLVDDNIFSRQSLRTILEKHFPHIMFHEAMSGRECLEIMADIPPDILFIDVHLNGEDGIGLIRQIRMKHPAMIIIVFIDWDFDTYHEAAKLAGVNNIIPKKLWTAREIVALTETILVMHNFMHPLYARSHISDCARR